MKILIVSLHFPPVNEIAALRLGKMASFLENYGHDVHVVTRRDNGEDCSLTVEVDQKCITRNGVFGVG